MVVLTIFPVILQIVINVIMRSIGGQRAYMLIKLQIKLHLIKKKSYHESPIENSENFFDTILSTRSFKFNLSDLQK